MKFEIITLFPDYFSQMLKHSLLGKAIADDIVSIELINLRDYATDKHKSVDDTPFGGGGGMVIKVEPLDNCLKALGYNHKGKAKPTAKKRIILTSAAGARFTQKTAIEYSICDRLTIICGHYLGVDERLLELYDIDEISIGDYVLTGGEPAAMVIVDAVARLIPKVLGNFESALADSFMESTVGCPCFTKPATYEGLEVPTELLSGNHEQIKEYRRREAIRKCAKNRPDLLQDLQLSDEDLKSLNSIKSGR